eukprot:gb/GECH01009720.1/.p1 GENE.gb/GECH01009720.1/~~gb/GECH01009720.1/.p1  ORF type:complete len:310 (+),score=47.39 gb/GECH01009720.1/:1-930(+)
MSNNNTHHPTSDNDNNNDLSYNHKYDHNEDNSLCLANFTCTQFDLDSPTSSSESNDGVTGEGKDNIPTSKPYPRQDPQQRVLFDNITHEGLDRDRDIDAHHPTREGEEEEQQHALGDNEDNFPMRLELHSDDAIEAWSQKDNKASAIDDNNDRKIEENASRTHTGSYPHIPEHDHGTPGNNDGSGYGSDRGDESPLLHTHHNTPRNTTNSYHLSFGENDSNDTEQSSFKRHPDHNINDINCHHHHHHQQQPQHYIMIQIIITIIIITILLPLDFIVLLPILLILILTLILHSILIFILIPTIQVGDEIY